MEYSNKEKIEWTIILVCEFGKKHGLNMRQSPGTERAVQHLTRL